MCFTSRMRSSTPWLVAILLVAAVAAPASAQEKKVGLVVGYPATVGVLWQATPRIAIRGEGALSWTSFEDDYDEVVPTSPPRTGLDVVSSYIGSQTTSTSTSGSIGASVLVTLSRADKFRTYLAPRVALNLSRSSTTIAFDLSFIPSSQRALFGGFENESFSETTRTVTAGASFGASASAHERLSFFGEVGFAYLFPNADTEIFPSGLTFATPTVRSVALRSGVGVTIFF
jgi:hypothetical protein